MKKIISFLLIAFTLFNFSIKAQTTTCNADFSFVVNGSSVSFTISAIGDTLNTSHYWTFGDGSAISTTINPTHIYTNPATYIVKHLIIKRNPNGVQICKDSISKQVPVTACNLKADFYFYADSVNNLKTHFINLTNPLLTSDSLYWSFGDGTTSLDINPTHTYANAGVYSVCLHIKRNNAAPFSPCTSQKCVIDTVVVCNLTANFYKITDTSNYLTQAFYQTTSPITASDSVRWSFGDGSYLTGLQGSTTIANPKHTYTQPGIYTVCLRVKKNNNASGAAPCVSEICHTDSITYSCVPPSVHFAKVVSTSNVLTHHYTQVVNQTNATDSLFWFFGDGTSLLGLQGNTAISSPNHTFSTAGVYNVCLKIKRNNTPAGTAQCINYYCVLDAVGNINTCALTSNFSFVVSTLNPLAVAFTNLSTPLASTDSILWSFGDSTTSTSINPTHTYVNGGTYNVCLRIKKVTGPNVTPCISEICKTITIVNPCNFQTVFTKQHDSINSSKINFTNLTVSPVSTAIAKWSFGDSTFATTWNATHTYAHPGTYTVCLTVQTTTNCIKQFCDTVVIPVPIPSCSDISKFTYLVSATDKQQYTFTASNIATNVIYTWAFGDNTGSHDPIVTHRYAQASGYTACLTSWRSATCVSTTCATLNVLPQINCDSLHVGYVAQNDPVIPNKYYFYANANSTILDQTWTITKLSPSTSTPVILHQNDPVYVFTDTGYYNVCLKAITIGGCVKEYCSVIHISQFVSNACELQAYPNPASNVVNVNVTLTQAATISATIYNTSNTVVKQLQVQGISGNNVVSIAVGDLIAGAYVIRLSYQGKVCYARFNKI